ncbi:MAG: hypothetical protein ACRD3Y_08360 [Bryobacteraceae bacterium]
MTRHKPLTDADGENREMRARDAAEAVPFSALPADERKTLRSLRKYGAKKALRPLAEQEAARRLAALGGTMPQLEDIPRRRASEE